MAVLSTETGEYRPSITWIRAKWKGANYFMGFQETFMEVAQKRFGSEAKDVFLYILGCLDYENTIMVPQLQIARQLGLKKQDVSRAIKVLVGEGILIEGPTVNRCRTYRLNDKYGWKGKLKNLHERMGAGGSGGNGRCNRRRAVEQGSGLIKPKIS